MPYQRLLLPGIALLGALLGACSIPTRAMLTYQSVPDGAEIFEGGKSLGTAPVTRTYLGAANAAKMWPYPPSRCGSQRMAASTMM